MGAGPLAGTRLDLDEELEATSLEHLGAARVEAERGAVMFTGPRLYPAPALGKQGGGVS